MTSRFLLPCDCGQSTPIQPSQAGQTVKCACGRNLTVPSMRDIRQLAPAKDEPAQTRRQRDWSATKGGLFAVGALMLIFGLLTAGYNYLRFTSASAFVPNPEGLQEANVMIDKSTPEELWDMWHIVRTHGLGDYESSPFIHARNDARYFRRLMIASSVVAGFGVVVLAGALLVPSGKSPAS